MSAYAFLSSLKLLPMLSYHVGASPFIMGGPLLMACCYLWIVCQRPAYVDFFAAWLAWLPLMPIGLSVLGSSPWVPGSRLLIPSAGLEGVLIRLDS